MYIESLPTSFLGSSRYLEKVPWLGHEELVINNKCTLNLSSLNFLIGKITMEAIDLQPCRVWYVQCLAKRLALNVIEFDWIHQIERLTVDCLAVKNFMQNACKIHRLNFVLKLFSVTGKIIQFSVKNLVAPSWMRPIDNYTVLLINSFGVKNWLN